MPKVNLFRKIVLLVVIMLLPIVGLYFYANKTSTEVLGRELNRSVANQLVFFQSEVNANLELLGLWPNLLMQDPDIVSLKDLFEKQTYLNLDTITTIKRVQSKLNIQESSSNWNIQLFIYSPVLERRISSNDVSFYNLIELRDRLMPGWQVISTVEEKQEHLTFSLLTPYPYSTWDHPEQAHLLIEVRMDSRNLTDMLDQYKSDSRGDPVYFNPEVGVIYNRTANRELADQIMNEITKQRDPSLQDSQTITIGGEPYLVNLAKSTTGWYLMDYLPLAEIVKPIAANNRLFYTAIGALLLMSCLTAYLLYAQVQVPLRQLVQGFQRFKNGDYSVRMKTKGDSEFGFVFQRFNSMVEQVQDLIEKIFMEQIHVKEARLKQLQSQINPHFFYNCFSFISSMAKLKNHQAVIAMSESLAKYYRYTTRQERELVKLSEELDFVTNYLEIQRMRRSSLTFEVHVPPKMKKLDIPPLVLQPLVENAVLHGIEASSSAGQIRITGVCTEEEWQLIVEDNGRGMTSEQRTELQARLNLPMEQEMGCGVWNVHQRMLLRFGETAGLTYEESELGGVKVTLAWRYNLQSEHNTESGELK